MWTLVYPKDINVYQAQKALPHAPPPVREGGNIIILAECSDGHGSELFYETMKKYKNPQEVVMAFQREKFRMGVHKAFLWTRSLNKAQVHLFSSLEERIIQHLMVSPARGIDETLEASGQIPSPTQNRCDVQSKFYLCENSDLTWKELLL